MKNSASAAGKQKLEQEAARWRAIVDSAIDAIIVIDQSGEIEFFNDAAARMFGYAAHEVLGRNISQLMPEPHARRHDRYVSRYIRTGVGRVKEHGRDVEAKRKNGTTFLAHLSIGDISTPGSRKFIGILRDLTDRVILEQKLREEAALARIGELAAVLAHEVKNPLAAVSGTMQILAQKLTSPADQEIIEEVRHRMGALDALMTDLLLYARPPRPRLAPVDISSLIEGLVSFLRMDPAWNRVSCRVSGDAPVVLADPELLKVAIQNLLVNALHALQGRGELAVALSRDSGMVHIDVIDGGSGIPSDVQERLFMPFFTTKAGGTGLGLATVKRIASAHHGEIGVRRTGHDGTTIRLSLPDQLESSG